MAFSNAGPRAFERVQTGALYDEGLRSYMLRVYNYMGTGLAITGLMAFAIAQLSVVFGPAGEIVGWTALGQALFQSPLKWVECSPRSASC